MRCEDKKTAPPRCGGASALRRAAHVEPDEMSVVPHLFLLWVEGDGRVATEGSGLAPRFLRFLDRSGDRPSWGRFPSPVPGAFRRKP